MDSKQLKQKIDALKAQLAAKEKRLELKFRLQALKKEFLKKQRKLEKASRVSNIRNHVKSRLADLKTSGSSSDLIFNANLGGLACEDSTVPVSASESGDIATEGCNVTQTARSDIGQSPVQFNEDTTEIDLKTTLALKSEDQKPTKKSLGFQDSAVVNISLHLSQNKEKHRSRSETKDVSSAQTVTRNSDMPFKRRVAKSGKRFSMPSKEAESCNTYQHDDILTEADCTSQQISQNISLCSHHLGGYSANVNSDSDTMSLAETNSQTRGNDSCYIDNNEQNLKYRQSQVTVLGLEGNIGTETVVDISLIKTCTAVSKGVLHAEPKVTQNEMSGKSVSNIVVDSSSRTDNRGINFVMPEGASDLSVTDPKEKDKELVVDSEISEDVMSEVVVACDSQLSTFSSQLKGKRSEKRRKSELVSILPQRKSPRLSACRTKRSFDCSFLQPFSQDSQLAVSGHTPNLPRWHEGLSQLTPVPLKRRSQNILPSLPKLVREQFCFAVNFVEFSLPEEYFSNFIPRVSLPATLPKSLRFCHEGKQETIPTIFPALPKCLVPTQEFSLPAEEFHNLLLQKTYSTISNNISPDISESQIVSQRSSDFSTPVIPVLENNSSPALEQCLSSLTAQELDSSLSETDQELSSVVNLPNVMDFSPPSVSSCLSERLSQLSDVKNFSETSQTSQKASVFQKCCMCNVCPCTFCPDFGKDCGTHVDNKVHVPTEKSSQRITEEGDKDENIEQEGVMLSVNIHKASPGDSDTFCGGNERPEILRDCRTDGNMNISDDISVVEETQDCHNQHSESVLIEEPRELTPVSVLSYISKNVSTCKTTVSEEKTSNDGEKPPRKTKSKEGLNVSHTESPAHNSCNKMLKFQDGNMEQFTVTEWKISGSFQAEVHSIHLVLAGELHVEGKISEYVVLVGDSSVSVWMNRCGWKKVQGWSLKEVIVSAEGFTLKSHVCVGFVLSLGYPDDQCIQTSFYRCADDGTSPLSQHLYSSDGIHTSGLIGCPLDNGQLVLGRFHEDEGMSHMMKYVRVDGMGLSEDFSLEPVHKKLLSVESVKYEDRAVAGLSQDCHLHIWNHEVGLLLATIDLKSEIQNLPGSAQISTVRAERGLLYAVLLIGDVPDLGMLTVHTMAINPSANCCMSLYSVSSPNQYTHRFRSLIQSGSVLVWDKSEGIKWNLFTGEVEGQSKLSESCTSLSASPQYLYMAETSGRVLVIDVC